MCSPLDLQTRRHLKKGMAVLPHQIQNPNTRYFVVDSHSWLLMWLCLC